MTFPDFPCDKNLIGYERHEDVLKYLNDYTDHFALRKYIKFNHEILNVKRQKERWIIRIRNLMSQDIIVKEYDGLFVCVGRYFRPRIPDHLKEDLERFEGSVIHSHDYRINEAYRQQNVVVLGAGPSGLDITIEISGVATKVFLLHLRKQEYPNLPENVIQVLSSIKSLGSDSVTLENGEVLNDINSIIWATGYHYDFQFMDESCQISIVNDRRVEHLFMHMINIHEPTMALFSIQQRILPFPLFHQQVLFFIQVLLGQVKLPSKELMLQENKRELQEKISKGLTEKHFHAMNHGFLWPYDDRLSEMAQIPRISQVKRKIFDALVKPREENCVTYRNQKFIILDEENYELLPHNSCDTRKW